MREVYAVLDIGSATTKLLVAETVSANMNILFSKKIISHGIRKCQIEDMDAVVADIKSLVSDAEKSLDTSIQAIALILPPQGAHIYQGDGITRVNSPNDRIGIEDVLRTLKLSRRFELDPDEEVVSTIPILYSLDTKHMEKIPLGLKSASLKVDSMVITSKKKFFYDYLNAVEQAGLDLLDVTIAPYAASKEAFDAMSLQDGAILIDIGYHTSTISFFEGGYLKYLAQATVGGYDLTKAIALSWQIEMDTAERYKVKYATCEEGLGDDDIIHSTRYGHEIKNYTQKDLTELMNEAVKEMMEVIKARIDIINDGRKYEIVIVGGGGELAGIDKIAQDVLGATVRCYRPETIGARDMAMVPCLGMMYYIRDRKELIGEDQVSLTLPDISNTVSMRMKGFTKTKTEEESKESGRLKKMVENFFSEE